MSLPGGVPGGVPPSSDLKQEYTEMKNVLRIHKTLFIKSTYGEASRARTSPFLGIFATWAEESASFRFPSFTDLLTIALDLEDELLLLLEDDERLLSLLRSPSRPRSFRGGERFEVREVGRDPERDLV